MKQHMENVWLLENTNFRKLPGYKEILERDLCFPSHLDFFERKGYLTGKRLRYIVYLFNEMAFHINSYKIPWGHHLVKITSLPQEFVDEVFDEDLDDDGDLTWLADWLERHKSWK